ncbi:MAG: glycosyltransferase family 2 protein [Deltaproteobacteria bacterium]|nr:MAG: glycosyltransferase family 2 protein [Deltaproteobacteria bacterium]RUA01600.1 MAG: glycosyltransferase family 2 protein [Deltaproteobacteria bacterium]
MNIMMPRVLAVVVNFNGRPYIGRCLDNLARQTFPETRIVVVDNGSTDGSAAYLKKRYAHLELILLPDNRGFSAANNLAIRSGNEEYIVLLNPDTVPDLKWVQRLVETLDANPEAGFAASKMCYYDQPEIIDRAGDGYSYAGAGVLRGRGQDAAACDTAGWIFGACAGGAIYRRSMLDTIGLFDEDFFLLYEDVDLSFRAQLQGYKCIYVPDAVIRHMASQSIGYDSPVSVYYAHRNLEWTYFQNMPDKLIQRTFHRHLLYDLAAFLFFSARGRVTPFLRAKTDALRGLNKALGKRKAVQRSRTVSDQYLWNLIETEGYINRIRRRVGNNVLKTLKVKKHQSE